MAGTHPDREPPGEEDRQIEQDDPGEQAESETEGEAPPPASTGDWQSRHEVVERDCLRSNWARVCQDGNQAGRLYVGAF
jgi:hypothetical protein